VAANDNVNNDQFGKDSHQEAISGIEGAHGVGFTRAGLQYGDGRKFAPIANISAGYSGISFVLPTEDPNVANTMFLTTTSSGHPQGKVVTDEYHTYPDSDKTAWRYNDHADVPSAMEHLAQGARERAGHLEAGTTPEEDPNGAPSGSSWKVSGAFGERPPLRPPSTISYSGPSSTPLGTSTYYDVDTETRERIPDKDQ